MEAGRFIFGDTGRSLVQSLRREGKIFAIPKGVQALLLKKAFTSAALGLFQIIRITPTAPKPIWKLHRLVLKKSPWRRTVKLPNGQILRVRYLAEGKIHYVFRVKNDSRLLRITKRQFYSDRPTDEAYMKANCRIMNDLAASGLSVKAYHLAGGACLVEDAGPCITSQPPKTREAIDAIFKALADWSLSTGIVILDYNEGNWCISPKTAGIRLVDIDINYTCSLDIICSNEIVRGRISIDSARDDRQALEAFLAVESDLLWGNIASLKHVDKAT